MLYTDHQALLKVLKSEDATGRIVRWQLALSEYDLDIYHVPGKDIAVADGLSRIMGPPSMTPSNDEVEMAAFSADILATTDEDLMGGDANPQDDDSTDDSEQLPQPSHPPAPDPDWVDRWQEWLEDPWYGAIVDFKMNGGGTEEVRSFLTKAATKITEKKAGSYVLIEQGPDDTPRSMTDTGPILAYRERNGKLSRCIHESQVPDVLQLVHDMHGHFANDITFRRTIGRFFWPTRHKDVQEYCRTCLPCQMLGPIRPTQGLLPVVSLQPLDLMGIDFIGPFTPIAESGARFIAISVDYMTRFLFGEALAKATAANTVKFQQRRVVEPFGYPRVYYHDNGNHFKGEFSKMCEAMGVKQIWAPLYHPSSVGLAERYVQLILSVFRAILQHNPNMIFKWDLYLQGIINAINTRLIKVFGFAPAELMLGFCPRYTPHTDELEELLRTQILIPAVETLMTEQGMTIEEAQYHSRLAKLDEVRQRAVERRHGLGEKLAEKTAKEEKVSPAVGDLVRLRRLAQDNQHSHKLEPRWEGPYKVQKVAEHGKSVWLEDLNSGKLKGKYHINDVRLYLVRKKERPGEQEGWRSVAAINAQVKASTHDWMRAHREEKKRINHAKGLDSMEEEPVKDTDIDEKFEQPLPVYPSDYGDEPHWTYWRDRAVNLQEMLAEVQSVQQHQL